MFRTSGVLLMLLKPGLVELAQVAVPERGHVAEAESQVLEGRVEG